MAEFKKKRKSICIHDRFTMVVWKSRAAAAQICRTTTPQSKPLTSHFFSILMLCLESSRSS